MCFLMSLRKNLSIKAFFLSIEIEIVTLFNSDNELWKLPNVTITPHDSAHSNTSLVLGVFRNNLKKYLNHETLLGVVDYEAGY